ncbi:MAG: hypothetical protein AB3N22_19335 [Ruegeria sp.]
MTLLSGAASAQCGDQRLVLDCAIGSKALTVCVSDATATYAFGPRDAPELALTQSLDAVTATPWPGIGRSIYEDVTFTNGSVSYTTWISVDRLAENQPTSGGVIVSQSGKTLAELTCAEGTAQIGVFAIADAMANAGYCVDRSAGIYTRQCPQE